MFKWQPNICFAVGLGVSLVGSSAALAEKYKCALHEQVKDEEATLVKDFEIDSADTASNGQGEYSNKGYFGYCGFEEQKNKKSKLPAFARKASLQLLCGVVKVESTDSSAAKLKVWDSSDMKVLSAALAPVGGDSLLTLTQVDDSYLYAHCSKAAKK